MFVLDIAQEEVAFFKLDAVIDKMKIRDENIDAASKRKVHTDIDAAFEVNSKTNWEIWYPRLHAIILQGFLHF